MKAAQTNRSDNRENAATAAAATSAAASAVAANDERFMSITIHFDEVDVSPDLRIGALRASGHGASRNRRRARRLSCRKCDAHFGIEAREPIDDFLACDRRVAELAMLLGAFACREDPRGDGTGADQLAHRKSTRLNS